MDENSRSRFVKITRIMVLLAFSLLSSVVIASSCFAAQYKAIKIYPENVGVFTQVGEQQFVAFGLNSGTNKWDNITTKVLWESGNENTVTIDKNGLATIKQTRGVVSITCTYPAVKINIGPQFLLLK